MSTSSPAITAKNPTALRVILTAGLLAGALDITAAILVYARLGAHTERLLQGIAYGLLGKESFEGGLATAALGLFLHFFIATTAAATYFAASLRLPSLVRRAVPLGALYGVVVYFFMNDVVVPLSAIGPRPFSFRAMAIGVVIHVFCVGLPISLTVRRFSTQVQPSP